jgi:hypothetical protein
MSDALLTEISKKLSDIHAAVLKAPAPVALKPGPATVAGAGKPGTTATPDAKAAAEVKAKADAAAATAAKTKGGPPAGTKGPNGKYTIEQVREKIRDVATNASLGKQDAADILDQDGGGVKKVTDLKPENYDKVYEACQVALQTEGSAPAATTPEDDLM